MQNLNLPKDVSGNASNRIFKSDLTSSVMKEKGGRFAADYSDTASVSGTSSRRSKRVTETPLSSTSSAKMSKASPGRSGRISKAKKGGAIDHIAILEDGRHCDVNFLLQSMDSTDSDGISGISLKAPKWNTENTGVLKAWLDKLGFQEDYRGFQLVFSLPLRQVDAFRRDLAAFRMRRDRGSGVEGGEGGETGSLGLELDMEDVLAADQPPAIPSSSFTSHRSRTRNRAGDDAPSSIPASMISSFSFPSSSSSSSSSVSSSLSSMEVSETEPVATATISRTISVELSEEDLWRQETDGNLVGVEPAVQPSNVLPTARLARHNARLNALCCSFDSEDTLSSTASTPSNASVLSALGHCHPDALSPTNQLGVGPEMTRVLSGVTNELNRLGLQNTVQTSTSSGGGLSSSHSSSKSLKELTSSTSVASTKSSSGDIDEDSDTESEGEDTNDGEAAAVGGAHSSSSSMGNDGIADKPQQKVWFGSVRAFDASPPLAFNPDLYSSGGGGGGAGGRPRSSFPIESCESPFVPASSRLSMGSANGDNADANPNFFKGWGRSSFDVNNGDNGAKRMSRPPKDRMLCRSRSESAVHSTTHSDAGSVTPGGFTIRVRPGAKEFSTPNSGVIKILSGEAGGFDWGVSKDSDPSVIQRMTDLLNSYNIPQRNEFSDKPIKPNALRRHRTMDDRLMAKRSDQSPLQYHQRGERGIVGLAIESPTPILNRSASGSSLMIGQMPQISTTPTEDSNMAMALANQNVTALIDENIIERARKALSQARGNSGSNVAMNALSQHQQQGKDEEGSSNTMEEGGAVTLSSQVAISQRNKRRIKKSMHKKIRMSMGIAKQCAAVKDRQGSGSNLILSPATPAKCRNTRSRARGRALQQVSPIPFTGASKDSMDTEDSDEVVTTPVPGSLDPMHELVLSEESGLDERNFHYVVVGGVYQHCFDDYRPVVAPPAASDKQVVGVSLQAGSLEIKLFISKNKPFKVFDLGHSWVWTRTAQDGYLVCSESLRASSNKKCYYLSRHPLEWADAIDEKSIISHSMSREETPLGAGDVSFMSGFLTRPEGRSADRDRNGLLSSYRQSLDDSMNCNHCFSPISGDFLDTYTKTVDGHGMSMDHHDETTLRSSLDFIDDDEIDKVAACWDNSNIISTVLGYLFDENAADFGIGQCSLVCKSWSISFYKLLSRYLSEIGNCQQVDQKGWTSFMRTYNWGKFLSSGACKDVYMVQSNGTGAVDAVSVMDINDLYERNMELAIKQEIEVALLCSSLVTLNICPNLVLVHSIFQSPYAVSDTLWRSKFPRPVAQSSVIPPKITKKMHGLYQYIRMEFCKGGDLEELVRARNVLDLDLTRSMLFQMIFSLYACREQIALRHYDVKLLNFFVTTGSALVTPQAKLNAASPPSLSSDDESAADVVTMHVAFGDIDFALPLRSSELDLVKLSDFGTSSVGTGSLGEPITAQQFTTLENTPPEFLILGSTARQAYSADTFCLGLSMLHVLTGEEPYEVLLDEVKCPHYLADQLSRLWCDQNNVDIEDPYYVICELVQSLVFDDEVEEEGVGQKAPEAPGNVLFDTIYRYMVLFGGRVDFLTSIPWADNPVWCAIIEGLGLDQQQDKQKGAVRGTGRGGRGKVKRAVAGSPTTKAQSIACYQHDLATWSIHSGTHPIAVRVQERLNLLGEGSWHLFDRLTHFDPARRCKMHEAMLNPIFNCLRIERPTEDIEWASMFHTSYTTYKRSAEQGGTDALHIL